MMIKVDQVRRVIETIYYRPSDARERVYIFTDSAFMKEAANSLFERYWRNRRSSPRFFFSQKTRANCCRRSGRDPWFFPWLRCRSRKWSDTSPNIVRSGSRNSALWLQD